MQQPENLWLEVTGLVVAAALAIGAFALPCSAVGAIKNVVLPS